MAHIKSLKPLTAKTDTYRNWVLYLYDVLNQYRQADDILNALQYELLKNNYQTFSEIRNELLEELNAANAEQEEFNNLKALTVIENMFINLNRYNEEFAPKKLSEIFKALKIEWNKADFDILKQISLTISNDWNKFVSSWIKELCNAIDPNALESRKQTILSKYTLPLITDSLKSRFDHLHSSPPIYNGLLETNSYYTFKWKNLETNTKDYIDALSSMHSGLIKRGYIDPETHFSKTKRIFSGESMKLEDSQKIIWLKPDTHLHYFIDLLSDYVTTSNSAIWMATKNCFIKKGNITYDARKLGKADTSLINHQIQDELNKSFNHILNLMA